MVIGIYALPAARAAAVLAFMGVALAGGGPASLRAAPLADSGQPPPGAVPIQEVPYLRGSVESGTLPPVERRLPAVPAIADFSGKEPGHHGGDLHTLIPSGRDVRLITVYGYAHLVSYDRGLQLQPDILQAFDVTEGRIFTFRLRPGHRWSNGDPFTAEDFRYWWEDVANNRELSPSGPPALMLVEGRPPRFEVLDEVTVRYTWDVPNPLFLSELASPAEPFIYRPSQYLKQFHERYADPVFLQRAMEARRQRSWAALHNHMDSMYRMENPEQPTLQPWFNTTRAPATRFVAERNPYFHRVDGHGRQLPYIDRIVMTQSAAPLIPAKAAAGEADLQARALAFSHTTFLKKSERQGGYETLLWQSGAGAHFALYPNLNANDPGWRALFRDVRFRRALSLGIDRELINQALFFGLALPGNNTVLPASPLFREEYAHRWADYDPEQANRLLDEIGLPRRGSEGLRQMPDGRPLQIIVETAGEDPEQSDILQLIRDDWARLGIKLFSKPSQREILRNRVFAGETLMAVWGGWDNGIPTAAMSPSDLAPTTQYGLQWPKWGQYHQTSGASGEAPDMPEAVTLLELSEKWLDSNDIAERRAIWHRMLEIHADQQYVIGVVRGVPQPVVVRRGLRNVPRDAIYSWDPGAHLGIYRPDTFWLDRSAPAQ